MDDYVEIDALIQSGGLANWTLFFILFHSYALDLLLCAISHFFSCLLDLSWQWLSIQCVNSTYYFFLLLHHPHRLAIASNQNSFSGPKGFGCVWETHACLHYMLLHFSLPGVSYHPQLTLKDTRSLPVQVDGEPWEEGPCMITISHHNQALMLRREEDNSIHEL